jgi:multimeric flavodoxin WrbA
MGNPAIITAIVGSYRRGGIIDSAVDEILDSAKEEGAEVNKIYLINKNIEFCTNCRACTQQPGEQRGKCPQNDEMAALLDEIGRSDALVLASPMNFWSVTAVMKRFIERLVCFANWPWGQPAPKTRATHRNKRAVVVASCAAPAILARLSTRMSGLLKTAADLLGAKTVGVLFMGLSAMKQDQRLSPRQKKKARILGKKLVGKA